MKISLKLQDNHHDHHHPPPPLLLRAKIPITIFNYPFLSHFSTTTNHPSDLSLSLSTNFPTFPSLKLSYAAAAGSAASTTPPLTLTLKSGTGFFGSPINSPLVLSAHFSFNPSNPTHPNPTFSLFLKPQLGSFSLRKSTFSHLESRIVNEPTDSDPNSFAFVPLEGPENMKDLPAEIKGKSAVLKGIQVMARTQMQVAQKLALNFRWGVNFSENQLPILRINKIGLHRVDDALKKDEDKKEKNEVEVLEGMCYWMKREVDVLTRVNREMKCELEEMKTELLGGGEFKEGVPRKKKATPPAAKESASGGFKQGRNTRNGEENCNRNGSGKREEMMKKVNVGNDVENELQRAIQAANAAAAFP